MAPLILYHFPTSGPSRAALLTIRQIELEAEIKILNLFAKEQFDADFLKKNPQHCVPTIDDNGFCLWESQAIVQYLAQSKAPGSSLLPSDPAELALVNQRLFFDAGTLYQRCRAVFFPAFFLGETKISDEKRNKIYEAFGYLEKFLEGCKWLCGDNLTVADLQILSSVSSIVHVGATLDNHPNLKRWYGQCATDVKGFKENDEGAKALGDKAKSILTDKF